MLYVTFEDPIGEKYSIPIEPEATKESILAEICDVAGIDQKKCKEVLMVDGEKFNPEKLSEDSILRFARRSLEEHKKKLLSYFDNLSCVGLQTLYITSSLLETLQECGFCWIDRTHRRWLFCELNYNVAICVSAYDAVVEMLNGHWLSKSEDELILTDCLRYEDEYEYTYIAA